MPIKYDRSKNVLHLYNKEISYLIHISNDKGLIHLYFGKYLKDFDVSSMLINTHYYCSFLIDEVENFKDINSYNFESSSMEFPGFGNGDYRPSAIKIKNINGDSTTHFEYVSHKIYKGKEKIEGLPALYGTEEDFTSLCIKVKDKYSNVTAYLNYSISSKYPVITRNMKVVNTSKDKIVLQNAYSACLDFKTSNYDMVYLAGKYAKERNVVRMPVMLGEHSIYSLEGKTSHAFSPFLAITSKDATEDYGDVYGINLAYSGNFKICVNSKDHKLLRVLAGINPDTFEYVLSSKQSFDSPEVILTYSDSGIGKMSRTYHKILSNHMIRGVWKNKKRPLLLNSWEGCFMNFNTDKILAMIDEAHKLDIEMFVLDDGWFGKRDNDTCSLGDWFVNESKLDLHKVIERLHSYNMKFGLWFEPEMVCPNSNLYKQHPDYAIKSINRPSTLMRHQMILDMSRDEVVDNIYNQIAKMLDTYKIDYIKWDFNRSITEAASLSLDYEHMGEFYHRFILGTYSLFERLIQNYPDVLIESCCAGGGRYDAGILYYSPQVWTSDENDPIERLTIQEGTSLCFPCSSMGAHVSSTNRTNYTTKAHIAMQGTFGYELDPTKLKDEEKQLIKNHCNEYHEYYELTHNGNLYRLINPSQNKCVSSWMFVSDDKKEALLTYVVAFNSLDSLKYIKLKGLDENKYYYCKQLNKTFYGKFLMEFGLCLTFKHLYAGNSIQYHFIEKD